MLRAFDGWLVDQFESFTHWFQLGPGKGRTNFWLARVFLHAATVFMLFSFLLFSSNASWAFRGLYGLCGIGVVFSNQKSLHYLRAIEEIFLKTSLGVNPMRLLGFSLRLGTLLMFPPIAFLSAIIKDGGVELIIAVLFFLAHLYFCACTPLPPGSERQKNPQLAPEGAR